MMRISYTSGGAAVGNSQCDESCLISQSPVTTCRRRGFIIFQATLLIYRSKGGFRYCYPKIHNVITRRVCSLETTT
ncbi:hypothetical protein L1987_00075 [Smallanthus sonchifolius]|uniref:Uncharacterized protein n=1 Tax=Smallanthus sonchifolius TaxID=185202 RepID=A0ACB9K176_9ASTR|nr:hypothetical protein L1987_00075 [Smallanthus sonchifolius]